MDQYHVVVRGAAAELYSDMTAQRLRDAGYTVTYEETDAVDDVAGTVLNEDAPTLVAAVGPDDTATEVDALYRSLDACGAGVDVVTTGQALDLDETYGPSIVAHEDDPASVVDTIDARYDWERIHGIGSQSAAILDDADMVPYHVSRDEAAAALADGFDDPAVAERILSAAANAGDTPFTQESRGMPRPAYMEE